jgi:hypothetical protein
VKLFPGDYYFKRKILEAFLEFYEPIGLNLLFKEIGINKPLAKVSCFSESYEPFYMA